MSEDQCSAENKQVVIRRVKAFPGLDDSLKKTGKKNERLDLLIETILNATCEKFTGYIKVNFTQGTIGRVEKFEEILRK
jgi:hypothetical protein